MPRFGAWFVDVAGTGFFCYGYFFFYRFYFLVIGFTGFSFLFFFWRFSRLLRFAGFLLFFRLCLDVDWFGCGRDRDIETDRGGGGAFEDVSFGRD